MRGDKSTSKSENNVNSYSIEAGLFMFVTHLIILLRASPIC